LDVRRLLFVKVKKLLDDDHKLLEDDHKLSQKVKKQIVEPTILFAQSWLQITAIMP